MTALASAASFVASARSAIPAAVSEDVRGRVLDLLGNAVAAREGKVAASITLAVAAFGTGDEATSLADGRRLPAVNAALINGTLAHALDFDDTHLRSVLHPSAPVIPAALAVAEARGVSGVGFLRAASAGIELCVRIGEAGVDRDTRDSRFFERGFHATSVCGALGAAAAAASLMDLDQSGIGHAIAIAASLGAGILEANRTGGTVKPVHCGWAAHAGVVAATLAEAGVTGPPTVFEGRLGFLRAHLGDRVETATIIDGLGESWHTLDVVYKPYPTNHFTHAVIDAALALRAAGVRPDQAISVELGLPEPTLRTIAEPRREKAAPSSGYQARFSAPFTFAAALAGGHGLGVGLEDLTDEAVQDTGRLELASRVTCHADEEASLAFPDRFGAVARVHLASGALIEHRVASSRGGPGNPLADGDLDRKFDANFRAAGIENAAVAVREAVGRLESDGVVADVMTAIRLLDGEESRRHDD